MSKKPVNCGCGGEAYTVRQMYGTGRYLWTCRCEQCNTTTTIYRSESEAITAWNRAMGITHERAVEYLQSTGWMEDHDYQMVEMGKEMAREDIPMEYFENGGI